jgi:hypothetical protein
VKKNTAKMPKLVAKAAMFATVKPRFLKNSSLTTGSGLRRSAMTNAAAAAAATAKRRSIHHLV